MVELKCEIKRRKGDLVGVVTGTKADGTQAIQKVEKKFIKINVENVNGRNYKPKV